MINMHHLWPAIHFSIGATLTVLIVSALSACHLQVVVGNEWRPQGDSNPCFRRERAVSWTRLDDGDAYFIVISLR